MTRMSRALAPALAVVALAGCTAVSAPATPAPPTPASSPAVTPAGTAAPSATASPTKAASFLDLISAGKRIAFKVAYKTTTANGQPATEQTLYAKGTSLRWDLPSEMGDSSIFITPAGTVTCIKAQNTCLKLLGGTPQLSGGASVLDAVLSHPELYGASPAGPRTIAGTQASCFAVVDTGRPSTGNGTMCFSAQGIPLLTQWSGAAGDFTMEATAFSTTVTDDDFKPYAPVKTLP